MPLRKRISLVAAASVAIAVAIAVVISFVAVRGQLMSQLNGELRFQASQIERQVYSLEQHIPAPPPDYGGSTPYIQAVQSGGTGPNVTVLQGGIRLPGVQAAEAVASGERSPFFSTVDVNGVSLREYTFPVTGVRVDGEQFAFQIARPQGSVNHVLAQLKWILAIVFLLVVGLAAALARLATSRVLAPLAEVTATAEAISTTEDLDRRIAVREQDEVGQLAQRFNEMLERLAASRTALDESVTAQRQLVADASHELRTPVTSLRTNIEVLIETGGLLDDDERQRLLADVVEQSEELSTLVSDLIEVARGDLPAETMEDTRLDRLVDEALNRARRNAPQTPFTVNEQPIAVHGNAERLNRAINNLLDNAARHTAPGTPVEVTVDGEGVTVRDHGDGIAQDDLPHVFDRFYRGADSRARQGSGLGLAIVHQVAEQHGGSVTAGNAPDGGAVFQLRLPALAISDETGVASHAELTAQ